MKKSLIVLCAAAALVGCNKDQGSPDSDSTRDTGFSSSRDTTYPSSPAPSPNTNSSLDSSSGSILTNSSSPNTNSAASSSGTTDFREEQPLRACGVAARPQLIGVAALRIPPGVVYTLGELS